VVEKAQWKQNRASLPQNEATTILVIFFQVLMHDFFDGSGIWRILEILSKEKN